MSVVLLHPRSLGKRLAEARQVHTCSPSYGSIRYLIKLHFTLFMFQCPEKRNNYPFRSLAPLYSRGSSPLASTMYVVTRDGLLLFRGCCLGGCCFVGSRRFHAVVRILCLPSVAVHSSSSRVFILRPHDSVSQHRAILFFVTGSKTKILSSISSDLSLGEFNLIVA